MRCETAASGRLGNVAQMTESALESPRAIAEKPGGSSERDPRAEIRIYFVLSRFAKLAARLFSGLVTDGFRETSALLG